MPEVDWVNITPQGWMEIGLCVVFFLAMFGMIAVNWLPGPKDDDDA